MYNYNNEDEKSSVTTVHVVYVLSTQEHELVSKINSKLNKIHEDTKILENSINYIRHKNEKTMNKISGYYQSIIELIKEKEYKMLNEYQNVFQLKCDEYKDGIYQLKKYNLMIFQEIDYIQNELFIKSGFCTFGYGHENFNLSPDSTKQKMIECLSRIEKYEKEKLNLNEDVVGLINGTKTAEINFLENRLSTQVYLYNNDVSQVF